jgi:hypothetical protein
VGRAALSKTAWAAGGRRREAAAMRVAVAAASVIFMRILGGQ